MKKKLPFIILLVFSIGFIFSFYGDVVTSPDDYLFSDKGDGIKNYFTYAYHIANDSSYTEFEGMNYPYGENFLYTDCHPALSTLLKMMSSVSDIFINYSIGILNFIMIFSIFLTFIVCYFLLRELKINEWISLIFGIGITLLSPQILRLSGHFALSYSMAIPLSWLLLLRAAGQPERVFSILLLFINILFWFFIHAYLGMIISFFLTGIISFKIISDNNRRKAIKQYLLQFSAVLLPVILFYSFSILTDVHTGRTDNPSGFFIYNAEFDDVLIPNHPPLKPFFDEISGNSIKQEWEAWSYIGLPAALLFITIPFLLAIKLFRRKKSLLSDIFFGSRIINISFISAFILLLFAMGLPFKSFPYLTELVPIVKQFRATGRFAWPFYFVSIVFAAYILNEIYIRSVTPKHRILSILVIALAGSLYIYEGIPYHCDASEQVKSSANLFRKELNPESFRKAVKSINSGDFQAIISLPFYYQGSESFSRPLKDDILKNSIILSYHTGLPLMCTDLTRTSVEESKKIVQIVSPSWYKKEIEKDITSSKPFLVIMTKEDLTKYENEILNKCTPLFTCNEFSLLSLKPSDLFSNNSDEILDRFKTVESSLKPNGRFYVTKDSSLVFYNGFETNKQDKAFRGNGAFSSLKKGRNNIAEFIPGTFSAGKKYNVSLWMYNGSKDALNDWFRFIIEEKNDKNNSVETTTFFPEQCEVINGNWSLAECEFEIKNPDSRIYIYTIGKDYTDAVFYADDLLLRESENDIYMFSENKDTLFYNNHPVVLKQYRK